MRKSLRAAAIALAILSPFPLLLAAPAPEVISTPMLEYHDWTDYFYWVQHGAIPGTFTVYGIPGNTPIKVYPALNAGSWVIIITGGGELTGLVGRVGWFEYRTTKPPFHPWVLPQTIRVRYKGVIAPNPNGNPLFQYLAPPYPITTNEPTLRSA